jgi:DNA-binding response OmpR family regulator
MQTDGRLAVIDGNRNFHPVMRGILRSLGYRRIEPFLEGAEALEHFRTTWCDLAFIDLTLIDGSGVSMIQTLRREQVINRYMPVVVLTSFTSRRNIEEAMAAGADYVLAKPVSPKLLSERMRFLKERPLDYIKLVGGYLVPDPTRFQPRAPLTRATGALLPGFVDLSDRSPAEGVAPARDMGDMQPNFARLRPQSDVTYLD